MAQQNIDFGSFPDDPDADAIRTAFSKVQNNFNQLFSANANSAVTSINRTPGAGITVSNPTGNVIISANLACLQVSTSTLSIGQGVNGNSTTTITSSAQTLVVDLPSTLNTSNLTLTGNANIAGNANVTGNINATNVIASATIYAANIYANTGTIGAAYLAGELTTATQPAITSVGTLSNLSVTGDVSAGNVSGNGAGLTSIAGANVTGFVPNANVANTALSVSAANISGTVNLANYATTANAVAGANVSGQVGNSAVAGTVYTNAQPNITSVGTLTSLSVTGNLSAGNANLGNLVEANFFQGDGGLLSNVTGLGTLSNLSVAGNIIPTADVTYDLGNATNRWNELWLAGNTIRLGNATISANSTAVIITNPGGGSVPLKAGGANTQIQYNDDGAFGGHPGLTFDEGISRLTANNFVATSTANLGAIGNITITGGSNGNVLTTYGNGVLYWGQGGGGNANAILPIANGTSNIDIPVADGDITFSVNGTANAVVFGNLGQITAGNITTTGTGVSTITSNSDIDLITANSGAVNITGGLSASGNVDFFGANVSLGDVANLHITGGSNGQALITDGNGVLSWANAGTGGGTNLIVQDEGNVLTNTANTLNFVGNGVSATANGNIITVTIPGGTPYGPNRAVQIKNPDGSNTFYGDASFIYDPDYNANTISNGRVEIGFFSGGGGRDNPTNTDLLLQGKLIIGQDDPASAYKELGTIRYIDDAGTNLVPGYETVYGFSGDDPNTGGLVTENWMAIVNEPGHEDNQATAIVISQAPFSGLGNNVPIFGISSGVFPYPNVVANAFSNAWTPLLYLTGSDLFVKQLSEATGDQVLVYDSSNGRITYSNISNVQNGIAIQEEGTNVVASTTIVNFVGNGVTASNVGGVATVTIPGSSGIAVQEEGTNVIATANTINFVGNSVTASNVGGVATVTIDGSGIPGGNTPELQFNSNGSFEGTNTLTWSSEFNSMLITATDWSPEQVGSILFKDTTVANTTHDASINYISGGRATKPGIMTTPWKNSYNNVPTRHDAGLTVWQSYQTGPFQRTQTTINDGDNGPSIHGVYIADGALDFFPDYGSGNADGLAYIILPAAFDDGTAKRYVGQISVNAYDTPGTPQWSLGWKESSSTFSPNLWPVERLPGNRNIIWDSNNHVAINEADLTESFNVKGNIRIEATDANALTDTGIIFADGTFQYTAATGSGGISIVQDEGTNVVTSANTINFVGTGVTASNVSGVATITITGGGDANVAGSNTQVQYNDDGVLGANAGFTFDKSNTLLTANNFVATSSADLGNVGNVTILGGTNGYFLQTDGTGNLTWSVAGGGSGNGEVAGSNTQIQYNDEGNFGATAGFTFNKTTTVFTANNIVATSTANLGDVANVYIGGGNAFEVLATVDGNGTLAWAAITPDVGGANTQVQYNDDGIFGGNPAFTFDEGLTLVTANNLTVSSITNLGNVGNVHIDGGSANYVLTTDGSGNLTWANVAGGGIGNISAGGANTQVQYNDDGILGGNPGMTFDEGLTLLTANNFAATSTANLGDVANVYIGGGNALDVLATVDGNGTLSWATLTFMEAAGANTQIQYNDDGVLGGNPAFTFDEGLTLVTANNLTVSSITNLGDLSNVHITGGNAFDVIATIDGTGNLGWATIVTDGAAGANTQVQYNDDGVLGGNPAFTFDEGTTTLTANNFVATSTANLGAPGNITITGGSNGYSLQTYGNGVLYWGNTAATGTANLANTANSINVNSVASNVYYIAGVFNTFGSQTVHATSSFTYDGSAGRMTVGNANITGTANVTGNISSGNANLGNAATANFFIGSGANLSNIPAANISGTVEYANYSTYAGSVINNAQANITSVGTLTGLTVSGVSNLGAVGNVIITGGTNGFFLQTNGSGNLSWANVANVTVANATYAANAGHATVADSANSVAGANVTGTVANATYAVTAGTANSVDGANVSGTVANATYAVTAGTANSVAGANVTGTVANATYAVTAGTANSVAGANVSGQVANALVAGTVYTAAQPNITSVGTLTSLGVTGNITGGNLISNGSANITNGMTISSGGASISGAVGVTGNLNITGNINVTGNLNYSNVTDLVVGDPLIYIGANNTGNLYDLGIVASFNDGTYEHTGLARDHTDGVWKLFTNIVAEPTTTIDFANGIYAPFKSGAIVSTGNITSVNANLGNLATANYVAGTLTTAAQPNITSVGTLTSLGVNGTVTAVAFTANTGVFTGNGSGLSAIAGANVTGAVNYATIANGVAAGNVVGQVANALVAGTVYTNAQPNITSVGTLTGLIVGNATANTTFGNGIFTATGNANVGNLGTAGSITATGNITGGNLTTTGTANVGTLAVTGNETISGNSSITGNLSVTGNITGAKVTGTTLVSTVATGTAPLTVTSTTLVNNLNADLLDGHSTATAATANTVAVRDANGSLTANVFIGSGASLTNIAGGNVTGQVSNALVAGTVYTNAQPNITSVGTLTSLSVTGNITGANVIANGYHIRSVGTSISAAGSTQGTGTALTKEINVVSTVASGAGVVLPTAVAGMAITITNTSANALLVYPASNAAINSASANTAYSQPAGATLQFIAPTTTQWYTVGATFA